MLRAIRLIPAVFVLLCGSASPASPPPARIPGANAVDAYRVRWWGTEGSQYDRPIHHVMRIDNGRFELRHGIVPGRPLADYRLPYWPIRSFVSVVDGDMELPHVPRIRYAREGKLRTQSLVVHEGFDLATTGDADVLRITNRGNRASVVQEHLFIVRKDDAAVEVVVRTTNRDEGQLRDVAQEVSYRQDFNWSRFGAAGASGDYEAVTAPREDRAAAFFAFSSGMARGYEFIAGDGCELTYRLDAELNGWQVLVTARQAELKPGESLESRHALRVLDGVPGRVAALRGRPKNDSRDLRFSTLDDLPWKQAPVDPRRRVTLSEVIAGMNRAKVRGLNLRTSPARALDDLETMKQWGANLVILPLGNVKGLGERVRRAHELGIEALVQGSGAYHKGPPDFGPLWQQDLSPEQTPDSYGQDEDHYYWHAPLPPRDFEADFGHPMAEATQEEKVLYGSRCFRDKWASVLRGVREHAPEGNIWFYTPAPGIARVEPFDGYDVFIRTVAELGEPLTVFPFYYGIEYNQAEYMVRRWKDGGVSRVVFLPMRGFLARPSQFLRVVTAARRGGADGACGFSFAVGEEQPENAWQWKSVMLAAWANFPTTELDAVAFIDEPAELVEALASLPVAVTNEASTDLGAAEFVARLNALVPRGARLAEAAPGIDRPDRLLVRIGGPEVVSAGDWPFRFENDHPACSQGVIQMSGRVVSLCGRDAATIAGAMALFARFAELARAEAGG